ncbi:MAG: phosphatidate cytidylyltransferase [Anaerolineales bacterium]|nr:phosphatidate cytidylyltransferase [Anaerolineales bacterium]MDW8276508.1 phosphatidate cytidylyltransferase [Anaerolineales bacterium]
MRSRVISALVLLAIGFPALIAGGVPYYLVFGFFLVAAAWEFVNIAVACGTRPSRWPVVIGVIVITAARYFFPAYATPALALSILALMIIHLAEYEHGRDQAGTDFAVGAGGLVYIGWVGSYLLDIRTLEHGAWWVVFILPTIWAVDTGAFLLGAAYGKHRMTPRLSPKKSWEGFFAGVFTSVLMGSFLAYAFSTWGPLPVSIAQGAVFGLFTGLLTPFGDLGVSMLKRQAGLKDSGNLIPGHGGALDRIDSWLWGAVLGYYFVRLFVR